jgi:hypothetical protein
LQDYGAHRGSLPPVAGSVVVPVDAGSGAADVGAVDVQRDGGDGANIANPVDVAGRRKSLDVAGVVGVLADPAQPRVESLFMLDAGDDGERAPGDVVMDAGCLAGPPPKATTENEPSGSTCRVCVQWWSG